MLNAGIDMFMMNGSKATTERLIKNLKKALNHPELFVSRIEDAVTKILQVKMAMGLV